MSNLNSLANAATNHLKQTLGGVGALDSGRFALGQTGIESSRVGNAAGFFGQLPYQEEMARRSNTNNLLGLASNWLGKAPVSYQTGGTQNQTSQGSSTSNTQGTQTQQGTPFAQGLANNLGGLATNMAYNGLPNFGQSDTSTQSTSQTPFNPYPYSLPAKPGVIDPNTIPQVGLPGMPNGGIPGGQFNWMKPWG